MSPVCGIFVVGFSYFHHKFTVTKIEERKEKKKKRKLQIISHSILAKPIAPDNIESKYLENQAWTDTAMTEQMSPEE